MKSIRFIPLLFLGVTSLFGIETTIKGGKMELLKKGEVVLFKEGVRLDRGPDSLKAREMETTNKRDKVKARGDVQFIRHMSSTETLRGFGRSGFYNTQKGEGYLQGGIRRAHLIYQEVITSTQTRRVDIYAKKIDFLRNRSKAIARHKVYGKTTDPESGDKYEFWADKAEYFGDEKKIILTGQKKTQSSTNNAGGGSANHRQRNCLLYGNRAIHR